MKYLTIFLFLSLSFITPCIQAASKIDTVYAGLFYGGIRDGLGADSVFMLGKPDKQYCKVAGNTVDAAVAFKKINSTNLQLIKANSTILIWGKKDPLVDSSSCQIQLWYDDGITVYSSPLFVFSDTL